MKSDSPIHMFDDLYITKVLQQRKTVIVLFIVLSIVSGRP